MEIINENTTLTLTLTFEDENGDAVTPSAARYKLDDVSSGASVLAWTAFSPSSSTHDLVITATQNAVIDSTKSREKRVVTVEITYGMDARMNTSEYAYVVRNLHYAP
jgi:hypothetical protein